MQHYKQEVFMLILVNFAYFLVTVLSILSFLAAIIFGALALFGTTGIFSKRDVRVSFLLCLFSIVVLISLINICSLMKP